jgi:hypothetical protein
MHGERFSGAKTCAERMAISLDFQRRGEGPGVAWATHRAASRSAPMRMPLTLPFLALFAAACGGDDSSGEPIGNPTPDELADRIEAVAHVAPEEEKAVPLRLGTLRESQLPAEYRTGRLCRLGEGGNLLLVAAAQGAVANVDGKVVALRTAGPVGPSGGFWEANGVSISIALKMPGAPAAANPPMRAGVTVGGDDDSKPLQKYEADWSCGG